VVQAKAKVLALSWCPSDDELKMVRNALPGVELVHLDRQRGVTRWGCPPEFLVDLVRDADAVMGWSELPLWAIENAKRLKFIGWLHAGCDQLDLPLLDKLGIKVANVTGANGVAVAEQAMALILGLAKRLKANDSCIRDGYWHGLWQPETASAELRGATICIVGYGNIGKPLARRCRAFGMNVLALRRRGAEAATDVTLGGPERAKEFFGLADYIVLALPLTRDTRSYIDGEKLSWLKPGSILINVARGELVRENDVYTALKSERLGAFASDIWWSYADEVPSGYSKISRLGIHRLPNVLASGDASANILIVKERMIGIGLKNVEAFFAGRRPPQLVDPWLGY